MNLRAAIRQSLALGTLALLSVSVISCGSGSSSSPADSSNNSDSNSGSNNNSNTDPSTNTATISGQAVDGFIVNGHVFCDKVENGKTKAAGTYTCPTNTKLVRVRHGVDVGFDETATSSNLQFDGEIVGPGKGKFITPLSTLAVELAGGEDGFDESKLADALEQLKAVFGLTGLTLDDNPKTNAALARLNAQLSQIVNDFAWGHEDYRKVMRSLSKLVVDRHGSNGRLDFSGGGTFAEDLRALNTKIGQDYTDLSISDETALNGRINRLKELCENIGKTENVDEIDDTVVETDKSPKYVFGVRESWGVLRIRNPDKTTPIHKITDFENPELNQQGRYLTQVSRGIQGIAYDHEAFDVEQSLVNHPVSIGISVKATDPGDNRYIYAVADGVQLSTSKGDAKNVQVYAPAGLEWHFKGVKRDGTVTKATIVNEEANLFNSVDEIKPESMRINFDAVSEWLDDRGHMDITQQTGNFEVTMVINGIKFARLAGDNETPVRPESFTVKVDDERYVTGPGLKGYVTVVPDIN